MAPSHVSTNGADASPSKKSPSATQNDAVAHEMVDSDPSSAPAGMGSSTADHVPPTSVSASGVKTLGCFEK